MESVEFVYLKRLIKSGEARVIISKFFVRKSSSLWFIYKDNQTLLWIWSFFWFFTSEWFWVPFSIFLAWYLHAWWLIIVGVAFSWIIDELIKVITYYFLPESLLQDENLFNYFWKQKPPHISIQSIKEEKNDLLGRKMPVIMIIPPQPWQSVADEFKKEDN